MNNHATRQTQSSAKTRPNQKPAEETIKETFESILIAFILAFVFRAYVVEAFVIPTGSMAPTLLGMHFAFSCPECGYQFDSDIANQRRITQTTVICPMCRFPIQDTVRPRSGDRILVHKYIYELVEPERWDVVVFKNPQEINTGDGSDGPKTNFIKRLIGLPEEEILIFDGNIYVKPYLGNWQIARKTDRPKVQNTVWQPIYHSRYIPLDNGVGPRRGHTTLWSCPWQPDSTTNWEIDDSRYYNFKGNTRGRLTFQFNHSINAYHEMGILYPYNQLSMSRNGQMGKNHPDYQPVEDIRLAVTIQPEQNGLEVTLSTTARLDDPDAPPEKLFAAIDQKGLVQLYAIHPHTRQRRLLASEQHQPLTTDMTDIEFWYVDQQASLWINGDRKVVYEYNLSSLDHLLKRPAPTYTPEITIELNGSGASIRKVELDRDLYYSAHVPSERHMARGAMERSNSGTVGRTLTLAKDEFFCLGDNSPASSDGRFWDTTHPWIELRMFESENDHSGIVPRELMIGRAFFVYYPAPYPAKERGMGIFPNFGDMRFIH